MSCWLGVIFVCVRRDVLRAVLSQISVCVRFVCRERPGLSGRSALKDSTKRRKADALKSAQQEKRKAHAQKQGHGRSVGKSGSGGYVLS